MINRIKNYIFRLRLRLANESGRSILLRSKLHYVGENVKLYTIKFGTEPYLISIHDNVTCAADVTFVTHDVSCINIERYLGLDNGSLDKVGSIELFDNCFIGARSILMPNCSVGKNSIVAAGSIVTKKIPDGEVWGGCPAKFIMTTQSYAEKILSNCKAYPWIEDNRIVQNGEMLKNARIDFFYKGN